MVSVVFGEELQRRREHKPRTLPRSFRSCTGVLIAFGAAATADARRAVVVSARVVLGTCVRAGAVLSIVLLSGLKLSRGRTRD